jgi:leucyl aminopeptidase
MQVTFKSSGIPENGTVVLAFFEGGAETPAVKALDKTMKGGIEKALKSSNFTGKKGETLSLIAPAHTSFDRVVLLGLGALDDCSTRVVTECGGALAVELLKLSCQTVTILLDGAAIPSLKNHEFGANLAAGVLLRSYRFNKYKTKKKEEDPKIKSLFLTVDLPEKADECFSKLSHQIEGVFLARNLMCEPGNVLTPSAFVSELMALKDLGVKVEVLEEAEMKKLGMNTLLAVGQGSENPSYLVVMHWDGGEPGDAPLAFVGKGVTFDTGGISIKPAAKMDEMKMDMGGAAVVSGLMRSLAGRKAKVNAIGVVGLVENMPDGKAVRPGDVVTSLSGQTVEILNTDAEGRLVLADALWYTQDRFHPELIIDLATLTHAVIIALGTKYAAAMGTDQKAIDNLKQTGDCIGEQIWQLPLDDRYDRDIDSPVADVKNTGANGAGSITAAQFLKRFTNGKPWIHMDIAGVSWSTEVNPLSGKYPSGFGVRLLDQFVAKYYEKSV